MSDSNPTPQVSDNIDFVVLNLVSIILLDFIDANYESTLKITDTRNNHSAFALNCCAFSLRIVLHKLPALIDVPSSYFIWPQLLMFLFSWDNFGNAWQEMC